MTPEEIKALQEKNAAAEKAAADAKAALAAKEAELKALQEKHSDPDLTKAIEAARKEEKNKLYGQIEALKTADQTKATELELTKKKLEEANKILEASKSSEADKTKTIEQKLAEVDAKYKTEIENLRKQGEESEKRFAEALRIKELSAYRERRIREAGDSIIAEMVVGGTEAEIDEAIVKAKQTFEAYSAKVSEKVKKELNMPPGVNPPGTTEQRSTDQSTNEFVRRVKSMSSKDWQAQRHKIAAEAGVTLRG